MTLHRRKKPKPYAVGKMVRTDPQWDPERMTWYVIVCECVETAVPDGISALDGEKTAWQQEAVVHHVEYGTQAELLSRQGRLT